MQLADKRIVITRPRHQAGEFSSALRSAGAAVIHFPVIEISGLKDTSTLDRALAKLACYDWLVLTSVNAVEVVWERLSAMNVAEIPHELRVAAIGPKTAASLQWRGVNPDFVPDEYVAEAILPGLGELKDCWVLLPRAELARQALPEAIQAAGGIAHEVIAYQTLPAIPDEQALSSLHQGVDIVTFTSSSTVRNFVSLVEAAGLEPSNLPGDPLFACIGPVTAATAREYGLPVSVVAESYTSEGLLESLLHHGNHASGEVYA